MNAMWDMWSRKEGKPFWELICDMEPEQLNKCIDYHHITDCITKEEGLKLLQQMRPGWKERVADIKRDGYPTYTTGAGWLGYPEDYVKSQCKKLLEQGFTHFKMKVGSEKLEDDINRAKWIRSVIGDKNTLMMDAN